MKNFNVTVLLRQTLASTFVDPHSVDSLPTYRLILIRPIIIGEVLRRVIGKTINWVLKDDIQEAARSLQTSTGLKAGAKAAIHAMRTILEDPSTKGIILVDARSTFNSLNRKVALHNIQIACPSFIHILINPCRTSSRMIIIGGADIHSTKGTTQSDNLVMSFCAIATVQIQQLLRISLPDFLMSNKFDLQTTQLVQVL